MSYDKHHTEDIVLQLLDTPFIERELDLDELKILRAAMNDFEVWCAFFERAKRVVDEAIAEREKENM